jgi:menaquinol-cytochrome c reductase iron-sulfur subunit
MSNAEDSNQITRRQFLKYVVAGSAGLAAVAVATPLVGYFLSPAWKQKKNLTLPIARSDSIPIGTPTFVRFEERVPDAWVITTESQGLWVVTKDGKNFTVFDPHCTHLNCPYYWDDSQKIFVCPCHGGRFDIDGNVLAGPPPRPLDRWESLINQGEIEVTGKIIRG